MSGVWRKIIAVVCIGGSALALNNVHSDNTDVIKQAEAIACGKVGCALKKIKESRGALSQSFTFQTQLDPPQTADVECRRSLYLVGEYSCQGAGRPSR